MLLYNLKNNTEKQHDKSDVNSGKVAKQNRSGVKGKCHFQKHDLFLHEHIRFHLIRRNNLLYSVLINVLLVKQNQKK